MWSDGSPTAESPGRENSAPDARMVGPTPTRSSIDAGGGRRGGNGSRVAARPSARAHDQTPSSRRGPEDGAAWRPAPREGARSARRLPSSQSLVNRRRPVLSVMVVASRPFDMVPDGLRSLRGQLSGAAGCFTAGAGLDGLLSADAEAVPLATFTPRRSYFVFYCRVDGVPAGSRPVASRRMAR